MKEDLETLCRDALGLETRLPQLLAMQRRALLVEDIDSPPAKVKAYSLRG